MHGTVGNVLPVEDCEGFHVDPLSTELDLSSQVIPILRAKCLKELDKVKILTLKNCKIDEIEPDAFSTMESLVELDLSNNLLNHLPENLFQHNKYLERVSLSNNKFTAVPYIAVPLAELDLSRNKISSLGLVNILDVQKLDLGFNRLETLSSQDMVTLNKVFIINIKNNPWKCGPEFDRVLCWSLERTDENAERTPIKCSAEAGYDISYTIPRRQELCEAQVENTDSQFSAVVVAEDEERPSGPENSDNDESIADTDNKLSQGESQFGDVVSFPQTPTPEKKKLAFYKSRHSARELIEEENYEAENLKRWEVFAFIGWMCAAVAIAVVVYIIYAFKLILKPSYKRIRYDSTTSTDGNP